MERKANQIESVEDFGDGNYQIVFVDRPQPMPQPAQQPVQQPEPQNQGLLQEWSYSWGEFWHDHDRMCPPPWGRQA